jgi:hypothetical protein
MWHLTKHGFNSAVCTRKGDGSHGQLVEPERMVVRARVSSQSEAIKGEFSDLLVDREITEYAGTDDAYRIFADKSVWSQVILGHDDFKSEVARHQGIAGADYEHSLHEVGR